jgi:hypothetical protein
VYRPTANGSSPNSIVGVIGVVVVVFIDGGDVAHRVSNKKKNRQSQEPMLQSSTTLTSLLHLQVCYYS